MSLQTPQVATSLTANDLEDLIRRVIREELHRILPAATPAEPAPNGESQSVLVEKDGFLVARTQLLGNVSNMVQEDRELRMQKLLQGLDL